LEDEPAPPKRRGRPPKDKDPGPVDELINEPEEEREEKDEAGDENITKMKCSVCSHRFEHEGDVTEAFCPSCESSAVYRTKE
jgi:hypothetical protein